MLSKYFTNLITLILPKKPRILLIRKKCYNESMIVVSDFDNTLYPHANIPQFQANLNMVQKFRQSGNLFCLASGRNISSLTRIWPEYEQYLDYIILENGATCLNNDGKLLFQYSIEKGIAQSICQTISDNFPNSTAFVYYYKAKEWPNLDCDVTKLRCWAADSMVGEKILQNVKSEYSDLVQLFLEKHAQITSVDWIIEPTRYHAFIDIMSIEAGKANAIKRLDSSSFSKLATRTITIGDDTNDIDMLKRYDGYAVKAAVPEVIASIKPGHIVNSVAELLQSIMSE